MDLVTIYECLCDRTRLRILNLLASGPLCVCHFQEVLEEPQVKISKHLSYLKGRGLVSAKREGNWMIYGLPAKPSRELRANLACLQDCTRETDLFRRDLAKVSKLRASFSGNDAALCCAPKALISSSRRSIIARPKLSRKKT